MVWGEQHGWTYVATGCRDREEVTSPCGAGGCLQSWALHLLPLCAGMEFGGSLQAGQPPACLRVGNCLVGLIMLCCHSLPLQAE